MLGISAQDWMNAGEAQETVDDDKILREDYPPDYERRFAAARSLLITGLCMRRTGVLADTNFLQQRKFETLVREIVLDRGGTVKIIMLEPGGSACRFGWLQDYWTDKGAPEKTYEDYLDDVRKTANKFEQIKTSVERDLKRVTGKKGEFRYYLLDYMLSCGLDIVDHDYDDAVAYVRYYPLASRQIGEDRPFIRVDRKNHTEWYDFYFDQFRLHEALAIKSFSGHSQETRTRHDTSTRPDAQRKKR
jgi:hypothetical protein